jgi:hypothetical protein
MAFTTRSPITSAAGAAVKVEEIQDVVFGFAAATLIAGGFGAGLFGVVTFISERWVSTQKGLTLSSAVGPLSGKIAVALVGWLVVWAILFFAMRGRNVSERVTYWATGVMIAIGLLLTFPPVWKLLGA